MNTNIFKNNAILKGKAPLISSIIAGIIVGICLLGMVMPQTTNADFANTTNASYVAKATNEAQKAVKTIKVVITAYSSTPDQTDDSPFITASNKYVRDGIVANNMLPFGTKVKIPSLYGDKIFVVEDRMNRRMGDYRMDIWFPTYTGAKNFGVKTAEIVVLED
jgi:3D (Asp-Asp-Asp) domain-containing protein